MHAAWHRLSLKSRVIFPVVSFLILATFVGAWTLSLHEQSGIRHQLEREAGMLANSLYHSTAKKRDQLTLEQAAINPTLHSVKVVSAAEKILYEYNRNQMVDRLLPGNVHYHQKTFSDGTNIQVGMFHNSILTLIFIYFATAALVILLVVTLLHVLLNHEVLLPINRLEQHMIRMAQGMLDKIIITESQSEIGHLCQSINAVRTRLKRLLTVQTPVQSPAMAALLDTTQFQAPTITADLSGVRILITDDDPTIRLIAGKILEKLGATPFYAEDGQECLNRLANETFDMVLLDLNMPQLSGFDVLKQIQNIPALQSMPVIVISSMPQKEITVQALQLGAVDYVHKPFDHNELVARIRTHLGLSTRRKDLEQKLTAKKPRPRKT